MGQRFHIVDLYRSFRVGKRSFKQQTTLRMRFLSSWTYLLISVAPLDGFVMNRVLGDYFENLLYKIFVAIDEQTTVKEVS